jgi:hypothetical protein
MKKNPPARFIRFPRAGAENKAGANSIIGDQLGERSQSQHTHTLSALGVHPLGPTLSPATGPINFLLQRRSHNFVLGAAGVKKSERRVCLLLNYGCVLKVCARPKKLALLRRRRRRLSWHTFFAAASQSFNLPADGAAAAATMRVPLDRNFS